MEKVKNAFEIYSKFLVDINLEIINNFNYNNNIKIIKEIMLILQEQKEFLYKLIYKFNENENINNIINNYSIFLKDNILSILNSNSINNKSNEKNQQMSLTNDNISNDSLNKPKFNYYNNEIESISLQQSENEIMLHSLEKSNLITNKENQTNLISNSNYTFNNQMKYESPKINKKRFFNDFSNSNNINNSSISSLKDINNVSYFEVDDVEEEPIYFRDQVFKRVLEKKNKKKFEKKIEQKNKLTFYENDKIKNKKKEFSLTKTKLNNDKKIKYESDKKICNNNINNNRNNNNNNNKFNTIKKLNRNKSDINIINKNKTYQKNKNNKIKYKNIKDIKNKLFDSKKLN